MVSIKIEITPAFARSAFKKYSAIAVLVDGNTREFCYPIIKNKLPAHTVIEVPGGEENKTLATCELIWQQMTDLQMDRHSLLIIVGGGVLGDMGGFCAATFKRGIDFMLMPTTLLAQVDASIGGKLAIDFGQYKNHIGVFQLPVTTQISTSFLETLSFRELRSGYAEIIKHCLIADKEMWQQISKKNVRDQDWLKLVRHSVKIKGLVVRKDPREKGLRKVLNFGHTIGHAIEGHFLSSSNRLLHGEAIAVGMLLESFIAFQKKFIKAADLQDISEYILSNYGQIELPDADVWLPLLRHDKKNKGNKILMALPKPVGKAVWDIAVNEKEIRDSLDYYRSC